MVFNLFASPLEGDFLGLAEHLACLYMRSLVERANSLAEKWNAPRVPVKSNQITPERASTRFWVPELGATKMALERGITAERCSWLSGQLALTTFLNGLLPCIDFEASGSLPLCIAGHLLYAERFRARGEAGRLVVVDGGGHPLLELHKVETDGLAPVWVEAQEADIVRLADAANASFASPAWMRYWLTARAWQETESKVIPKNARSEIKQRLEQTLLFMRAHTVPYFLWVAALLREVVPLAAEPNGTKSASFVNWPAHVHISQASLIDTLVVLVHECSHQYFHMALWYGPATKPGAPEVYSVLKGVNRPLDKILLGFHAFGNVLLALCSLRDRLNRSERIRSDEHLDHTRKIVLGLDAGLQAHWENYLDEIGKQIYVSLRMRLSAAALL
jgi:HEXXH motif-containing protein